MQTYIESDLSLINRAKEEFFACLEKSGVKVSGDVLVNAMDIAIASHEGQYRSSGEPYVIHPIKVAEILIELKLDVKSIATALLHDTLEDTKVNPMEIEKRCGKKILQLVEGVTKLAKIEYQPALIKQAENFRKLLVATSEDIRVLLVKLADRIHNMRTLGHIASIAKRQRIASETMEIYAPLAERIGIHSFKNELQDLAFSELYPDIKESINSRLEFLRKTGVPAVKTIIKELEAKMHDGKIDAKVTGREKTCCAIWYKMEEKNIGFEQLSDIMAFRIIVNTIEDCYRALGVIHQNYHMIPGNFKDFISLPKSNGYMSLHTVVMGPKHHCIEIQIRTNSMHEIAEFGVAAHWGYKDKTKPTHKEGQQFKWITELLDILNNASNSEELLENTKLAMYYDRVFCFTPKGELVTMPRGATALDFAFAMHTDIGLACAGARVNGKVCPLKTQLENGDQVEILKSTSSSVTLNWENFVITGKAKSEIRKYLRSKQRNEYYNLGQSLLSKTLSSIDQELNDNIINTLVKSFDRDSKEELVIDIGSGIITRGEVINTLSSTSSATKTTQTKQRSSFLKFKPKKQGSSAIPIQGLVPGIAVHIATCCSPVPGDKIVGIMHSGKGVDIHAVDCHIVHDLNIDAQTNIVDIHWDNGQDSSPSLTAKIVIILSNEIGSLARVSNVICDQLINIQNLKIISKSIDFFELLLAVEVRGISQLKALIIALKALDCVHSASRFKK